MFWKQTPATRTKPLTKEELDKAFDLIKTHKQEPFLIHFKGKDGKLYLADAQALERLMSESEKEFDFDKWKEHLHESYERYCADEKSFHDEHAKEPFSPHLAYKFGYARGHQARHDQEPYS